MIRKKTNLYSAAEAISPYYDLAREVFQSFPVNAVHRKGFDESSLGMMETTWKAEDAKQ